MSDAKPEQATEKKPDKQQPRLFTMVRHADESNVSGTGRVMDGVLWHTGQVTVCWRTDIEGAKHGHSSLGVYPSWAAFDFIHLLSHPTNRTEIVWLTLPAKQAPEKASGQLGHEFRGHANDSFCRRLVVAQGEEIPCGFIRAAHPPAEGGQR